MYRPLHRMNTCVTYFFESGLCNMDTVWVLDFATRLSPSLIREIYHLVTIDWSKPKLVKHVCNAHTCWIRHVAYAPGGSTFVTVPLGKSFKILYNSTSWPLTTSCCPTPTCPQLDLTM
jgi:hypothetical protein